MKSVLLIAFAFPPHPHIGSQRPYGLAKYFPQYGWDPLVLTPKREDSKFRDIKLIETEMKYTTNRIREMIRFNRENNHSDTLDAKTVHHESSTEKNNTMKFLREAIKYPDEKIGWFKYAVNSASEYLDRGMVNAIISTSYPVTSHLIARKLKLKYNIPWIADLRDLWVQNHFYNKFALIRFFEKRLELKTLADTDAIVTVTPRFADKLKILHKDKEIICITNGYDHEDFQDTVARLTDKFTITYTGGLYNGRMDPSILFEVVSALIQENYVNKDLIEIRFFGRYEKFLVNKIKEYGLGGIVNHYDYVPRVQAIEKQKESQLLLLLVDNDTDVDYYPAKIFEYFGARRPILALGGRGRIIKELLEENNAGVFTNQQKTLRGILLNYYNEFIKDGEVSSTGNKNNHKYEYKSIAGRYARVLDDIA